MKKRFGALIALAGVVALLLTACVSAGGDSPSNAPIVDNAIVTKVGLEIEDGGKLTFIADRNEVDGELYVQDLTITFFQNDAEIGSATSTYSDLAGSVLAVSIFAPDPKDDDKYHVVITGGKQEGFDNKDITYNPDN